MSREVGVAPDRVAQAATALEQLRDAANVPVIVNTLAGYPAGSAGPLRLRLGRRAQDRSARGRG